LAQVQAKASTALSQRWVLCPNPAIQTTWIFGTLDQGAEIFMEMHALDGSRVEHQSLGVQGPGAFKAEVNLAGLPMGIYFVTVLGPQGPLATVKLAVVP
jgi:hypothetical protein